MDGLKYKPSGLVVVTGPHGVGKTLFSLYSPGFTMGETVIISTDNRDKGYIEKLIKLLESKKQEPPKWFHMPSICKIKNIRTWESAEYFHEIENIINNELEGFKRLVICPYSPIQKSCRAYAFKNDLETGKKNADVYRPVSGVKGGDIKITQGAYSAIGRMKQNELYTTALSVMGEGSVIFIECHLSDMFENGKKVIGRKQSRADKNLMQDANFIAWLSHSPNNSGVPMALLIKKPHILDWDEETTQPYPLDFLPPRLVPDIKDKSLWETIKHYSHSPYDPSRPKEYEKLSKEEFETMTGALSEEQIQTVKLALMVDYKTLSVEEEKKATVKNIDIEPLVKKAIEKVGKNMNKVIEWVNNNHPDVKLNKLSLVKYKEMFNE